MKDWFRIWGVVTGQWLRLREYWAAAGGAITIIAALGVAGSSPESSGVLAWISGQVSNLNLIIVCLLFVFTLYRLFDGRDTLAYASIKDIPGVSIRIVVGDLLRFGARKNALIAVGMNNDWKCELTSENGRIAPGSLQGQVTSKWFGGSGNLRAALTSKIEETSGLKSPSAADQLGQTVRLDRQGKSVMWLTMARWDQNIGAYSTTVPELEQAMGGLWDGLRATHNLDDDIFCPIIGAAFGKIGDESPLDLLKRHIRSFVTASKEQKITETLTFVISPKDLRNLNLSDLRDFLTAECRREALKVHKVPEAGVAKEVGVPSSVSFDQEISDVSRELAVEISDLHDLISTGEEHVECEGKIIRRIENSLTVTMRRLFSDERPLSSTLYSQNVRSATECLEWQKARLSHLKQGKKTRSP